MSHRFRLILILFLIAAKAMAGEVQILDFTKQETQGIPYYFDIAPEAPKKGEKPKPGGLFQPKPDDISCSMTELGKLGGKKILSFRYVKGDPADNGRPRAGENPGAVGLSLLCSMDEAETYFAPFLVIMEVDPQKVADLTTTTVSQLNDFGFIWVRIHYKGPDSPVKRYTVIRDPATGQYALYDLFSNVDPLAQIKETGWRPGKRSPSFDEETLIGHFYLDFQGAPADAARNPDLHRHYSVKYSFAEGKLQPGEPVLEAR